MSEPDRWSTPTARLINRIHARIAGWSAGAKGFRSQPEPRHVGRFAKGRQLVAGNFLFAGHLIEAVDDDMWDLNAPSRQFAEDLHGFGWLDDLAAVGDLPARKRGQDWTFTWIARYGPGKGGGWAPDLTGRRLIRWINHALFLLSGADAAQNEIFYKALAQQTVFLSRRWKATAPGLPRLEALCGLIYAGLSLDGMDRYASAALSDLCTECRERIDSEGGLPTRNPEELLDAFTLLSWCADALRQTDQVVPKDIRMALERIAPTLRALRHSDGGLARFHGGGRGMDGYLDAALATSGIRAGKIPALAMGYARLSAGRTSIVVDAAKPPQGEASYNAHASTCALEITSGRRPLIVNCGAGGAFGEAWHRAGRATPSHSVLGLEGVSSSRMEDVISKRGTKRELLVSTPQDVPVNKVRAPDGTRLQVGHDGWRRTHGLMHARTIDVTLDGRGIAGEDLLTTMNDADQNRFNLAMSETGLNGIRFAIRFHLHPDVDAQIDLGGSAISLALRSGEIWVFRHDGSATLSLEPSVYLEKGRLNPRPAEQIVLSARATSYSTRVRWSLAKAKDTPTAIRDTRPFGADTPDEGSLFDG